MTDINISKTTFTINQKVASCLQEIANLLEEQQANPFRVNAYRHAATTVSTLQVSVKDIVDKKGFDGLTALPNIGTGIGRSIYEFVATEEMTRLESLRANQKPEDLLQTVPGIGPKLASRLHEELHINTLEALEVAAHNGRLEKMKGVGKRKTEAIQGALINKLGRRTKLSKQSILNEPSVSLLLEIDTIYRTAAENSSLPTITPKRFNPDKKAWLPVLHKTIKGWHFTTLFSNTARAHELHKTTDWVVIYFYDEYHQEGQHTVVTETHGPLVNKRVVRGREWECRKYYDQRDTT